MEIILVRHAQPAWASATGTAVSDPGLTEIGRRQAQVVAERLAATDLPGRTELLVSTATRSRETAEPIAEALGLTAAHHAWIHEIRLPAEWEGTPAQEIGARLRDARSRPRDQWWEGLGEGSESFRDFHQRVSEGLDAVLAERDVTRHADDPGNLWTVPEEAGRLIVVAHAGTNSVVLGHLLGLAPQPWEWERFSSNHASITLLDTTRIAGASIFALQLFSGVAHFEGDLITA